MEELFNKYHAKFDPVKTREKSNSLLLDGINEMNVDNLKRLMGSIDLTSLNSTDSVQTAEAMCDKVNRFGDSFDGIPNVAGICVFPSLAAEVKNRLEIKDVDIVSVSAGFPASQTFTEVKIKETEMAVAAGATEIDIVLNLGKFLAGDYRAAHDEIEKIKKACGIVRLKVILETGVLPDYDSVWEASILAMDAGADFVKTSTGKLNPAATPDKFLVMAKAVKEYHKQTKRKVGIKAAGGVVSVEDALTYFNIVKSVLGDGWLNRGLFRIGASRLANNLLAGIYELMGGNNTFPGYF